MGTKVPWRSGGTHSARRGQGQRCQEAETGPGQAGPRDSKFIVYPVTLLRKCATPEKEKETATKCPCRPWEEDARLLHTRLALQSRRRPAATAS